MSIIYQNVNRCWLLNSVNSRQLEMAEIGTYDIPEEIEQIEYYGEIPSSYENLILEPKTIDEYIFKYKSLLYLEEAAGKKRLMEYDLKNIKLRLHSRKEQTFQIVDELVCSSKIQDHKLSELI